VFFADNRGAHQAVTAADLHDGLRLRLRQRGQPGPRLPPQHQGRHAGRRPLSRARSADVFLGARDVRRTRCCISPITFVKRLTEAEKEQIYLESKTWYRRYGVSDRPMPANYAEFQGYWDQMMDEIVVGPPRPPSTGVGYVTKGFPCPNGVPAVLWRVIAPGFKPRRGVSDHVRHAAARPGPARLAVERASGAALSALAAVWRSRR